MSVTEKASERRAFYINRGRAMKFAEEHSSESDGLQVRCR